MTALLATLNAWAEADRPWSDGNAERRAAATETLLTEVAAMADAGERDALRVWGRITDEQAYTARNAERRDPMHRKVPDYGPIVHSERARLAADRDGIPAGAESAWCPACRTRREVWEVDPNASTYEGSREVGWVQTNLACGHSIQGDPRTLGPSPGGEAAAEALTGASTQARLNRAADAQDRW